MIEKGLDVAGFQYQIELRVLEPLLYLLQDIGIDPVGKIAQADHRLARIAHIEHFKACIGRFEPASNERGIDLKRFNKAVARAALLHLGFRVRNGAPLKPLHPKDLASRHTVDEQCSEAGHHQVQHFCHVKGFLVIRTGEHMIPQV